MHFSITVEINKLLNPDVSVFFCHEHVFSLRIFIQGPRNSSRLFFFFRIQSQDTKSLHYENLIESRDFVSICTVKYFASASWKDIILSRLIKSSNFNSSLPFWNRSGFWQIELVSRIYFFPCNCFIFLKNMCNMENEAGSK